MNIVFLVLTYNGVSENRREEGQVQTIYVPNESGMLKIQLYRISNQEFSIKCI